MEADMQIIQTKDFEAIAHLNKTVQDVHAELYPDHFKEYNYETIKEFFKSIIDRPNYIFLILENDQQNIGYAWIEIKEYAENPFKKAYKSINILQLSINSSEQNKGYGSQLMAKINEIAELNKIGKIELDYWHNNGAAKDFYRKHGYKTYREFVFKDL
ncbi:GNAT family N-acetyltransferase [Paenibacillus radicis (ex Xue et al. 2023)]|uniref:GNAT family N-acetyltransferase n=1 Tax=Paenibacillus radicis (ex Xue et al. 2023) TaxID=2972489 RepID=A0ABT1YDJ8_9BACL|nr:GNAT family N-acetyltransferase [Paenibacillus radicis (ex Xue et al. 2023)]MCR8630494.1 GNAT family N-acetyltransferase [Paenibacillus radicis (ex Xue et al. 2023)]